MGDIRSRLLLLAPGSTRGQRAVRRLLGHRLVSMQSVNRNEVEGQVTHAAISKMAREEWMSILDGGHESHHQADETDEQESYEHTLWHG